MKPTRVLSTLAFCAFALSLGSCGRGDYLYFEKDRVITPPIVGVHKLSEVVQVDSLDILWVIDNSGSMDNEQRAVIANTKIFMDSFAASRMIDWRMGLISTSINEAPYIGFERGRELDWRSPNPVGLFQAAVDRLKTSGDFTERGFDPIKKAVAAFPNFVRPRAVLAMIFLSDIDDQSTIRPDEFVKWVETLKGRSERVVAYGVLGAADIGCPASGEASWNYGGSRYEKVINAFRGKNYKLCDADFGTQLASIGRDLLKRVEKPKIYLNYRPKKNSLVVRFAGAELPGGAKEDGGYWYYDFELNAIVFHDLEFAPGDDEKVEIELQEDDGYEAEPVSRPVPTFSPAPTVTPVPSPSPT
jgi:hypothetical protein